MKKLFTFFILLTAINVQAQIGNYNGKPRYNILAVRAGNDTIGNIVLELYPTIAPKHVRNWDSLTAAKFFDSTAFHRVIPGFVIQGGDPNSKKGPRSTWGYGQPWQVEIPAEFNPISHQRSILSAARDANPNSANSQFFICVAAATNLDNNYTAYGKAISGMNVVDNIVASTRDVNDNPLQKIEMFVTRIADDTTKAIAANITQPANNATGISGTYQFKWEAVSGAVIYELEISSNANFSTIDTFIRTNKLFALVPSLKAGELQYYWRLQTNNGGYKKATEIRTFTTGTFPPSLVLPTNNQVLTVNQVMFNWNGVASASSYKLQVATNPNFTLASIKIEEDSINANSIVKSLEPNKKHFWRVASEINGIAGAYSPAFAFTTGVAVGVSTEQQNTISIYPNPASTQLFVEGLENFEYKIYDRIGKLVLSGIAAETAVNISTLEAGMYLIKTDKGISRFVVE